MSRLPLPSVHKSRTQGRFHLITITHKVIRRVDMIIMSPARKIANLGRTFRPIFWARHSPSQFLNFFVEFEQLKITILVINLTLPEHGLKSLLFLGRKIRHEVWHIPARLDTRGRIFKLWSDPNPTWPTIWSCLRLIKWTFFLFYQLETLTYDSFIWQMLTNTDLSNWISLSIQQTYSSSQLRTVLFKQYSLIRKELIHRVSCFIVSAYYYTSHVYHHLSVSCSCLTVWNSSKKFIHKYTLPNRQKQIPILFFCLVQFLPSTTAQTYLHI